MPPLVRTPPHTASAPPLSRPPASLPNDGPPETRSGPAPRIQPRPDPPCSSTAPIAHRHGHHASPRPDLRCLEPSRPTCLLRARLVRPGAHVPLPRPARCRSVQKQRLSTMLTQLNHCTPHSSTDACSHAPPRARGRPSPPLAQLALRLHEPRTRPRAFVSSTHHSQHTLQTSAPHCPSCTRG